MTKEPVTRTCSPQSAGQFERALRVRAEKAAEARVVVGDEECARQVGQPAAHQPVRALGVLLHVVVDQVAVRAEEMRAAPVVAQDVIIEEHDLQAEIQQGLFQAVLAERRADAACGAQGVEPGGALFALGHCQLQPLVGRADGKALQRGLVQVVQHLADDAAALDADGVEFPLGDRLVHQRRHVVLGRFEGEERGLPRRLWEAGRRRHREASRAPRRSSPGWRKSKSAREGQAGCPAPRSAAW